MKERVTISKTRYIIEFCSLSSYCTSTKHQYRQEAVQIYQQVGSLMQTSARRDLNFRNLRYQTISVHDTLSLARHQALPQEA